jgi:hypothetical protein
VLIVVNKKHTPPFRHRWSEQSNSSSPPCYLHAGVTTSATGKHGVCPTQKI